MPQLLHVPDEILHRILTCVSEVDHGTLFKAAAVNRQLNSIATPLLVRYFKADFVRHIELLALHLLRYPELRKNVRRLELDYLTTWGDRKFDRIHPQISPNELNELAEAAIDAWPALAETTNWVERIRFGVGDAIATLVLTWAINLTHLDLTVPCFNPLDRELVLLMWVAQVVRRYQSNPDKTLEALPLMKLTHFSIAHWDTEDYLDSRYSAPFFYLPNVKTFLGRRIGCGSRPSSGRGREHATDAIVPLAAPQDSYITTFPKGTSNVEEVSLKDADPSSPGLPYLVLACRNLTRLYWCTDGVIENEQTISSNTLARLFMHHSDTLKELSICWVDPPDFYPPEEPSHGPTTLPECFQYLKSLEDLAAPMHLIFRDEGTPETGTDIYTLGSLPQSLKILRPESVTRPPCVINGLEKLLQACGPEGQFPAFRELNLFSALDREENPEGVAGLERLAATKGVDITWSWEESDEDL